LCCAAANNTKTTDDILKEYENLETDEESVSVEEIPDDTMDQIIASINENEANKEKIEEDSVRSNEVATSLLEDENNELKNTIKTLKIKLEESEENSLKAQMEVSSLTEKTHQLEIDMQIKDDQNSILLGEKNSLEMKNYDAEARISKINAAIHKIYNEKEALKIIIDNQKTTIGLIQDKSPVSPTVGDKPTSAAVKKLNDNMKSKTAEVNDLKAKNKQLADELAELQNTVNNKSDNGKTDESEKCSKLTKVVSNKSKEISALKAENKVMKERNQESIKKS
jgi:chromosome segregation ATPase